ncbi:C4-dicarboxylate ABC transporter substrate-binding protein [candidate division KSB3 bacterium]|uniref:C4-dicarboxylate ABC transporter substrate-binding protein n=1 Tax=candidate division KSB3 bacterium TaxID=2044937 RepID=A0A2G6KEI7_9BACT|nr:MAG: C4-dicarboxylate ABC transporter substrate-binding protein [candidate division KSB3 bacterium]
MFKKMSILLLVVALCVSVGQIALAKTVIRVAHTIAPDSHYNQGLLKLGELLKERTNGELELEVYHSAQLGSERDAVEGVAMGTLEMTLVSSAPLANFTNKFMIFNLPFIVRDREKAYAWMDGPEGQKILDSLLEQNIVGLGIWENGFRNLTNSKVAVKAPEDVKGLKIRLMENPIHVATFKTLGAYPVPMPFGELFTALQQKTVDGQENPLIIIHTSKFAEVQKYVTLTGHFYAPAVLLINKAFWENTLTEEQRKIFKECEQEAKTWERQFSQKGDEELAKSLKEDGMEVISPDKATWVEATKPVYKQFEEQIGKEMIDSFVNAQN